ncbi:MAG: hypothetical protein ACUVYA_15545 [Planctomycetota bacterium]
MHKIAVPSAVVTLILALACPALAEFRAGIAVRVVTPDPLLPISGGIGPARPARETRGDLTVRALVLDDGATRLAIVSADFLGFPAVLGDRVRAKVPEIPRDAILIGATHTHSAPDLYGFPDGKGGTSIDLSYAGRVVDATAAAIREALGALRPAGLRVATGEARGKIAYNYYAPELYDPRVSAIQAVAAGGDPVATLVNYAIHPEVLGNERGISSPDLVGPLCDRIAERGGGTGIFLNGAQGGMVTADNRRDDGEARTWEECVRIGRLLADEALRIVSGAPIQAEPAIRLNARTVRFPVESLLLAQVLKASPLPYELDPDGKVATRVALADLGDARILTIPGEALPNIGYYLKRKMGGKHNLLFGLTNDAFGYILTSVDWGSFRRYDYISRTSLGERTGDIFIEEALRLVAEHDARTPEAKSPAR